MQTPEVLIVGAGPAGIAAALRLARAGVRVLVLEGADYAGAENWSGCVYHADDLLREDVLGRELWAQAPTERRVTRRALFFHDGVVAGGFEARAHRDNDYGEAWTVLRPKLDRWLAARAIDFGATLLPATTVTGLRYDGTRVVGVNTERGAIEADVVFLAEGDAAGLLAREGLERCERPHYAQGIKAVFALPPAEIERRFELAPGEGLAQEWIMRNARVNGRELPLDATAFLYTNRDSLSLGLVLPLTALAQHMPGDHAHLLQRVRQLPGIAQYLGDAKQVAYGAKVIRAGGVDETPVWVRDGLAVGGGALGLGMEFPYPNFIGPAIVSGLHFADAVLRLRSHGSHYRAAELEREYCALLKASDDFANAELLRAWPAAIHHGNLLFEQTPALIGQYVDAAPRPAHERVRQQRKALAIQLARVRKTAAQARGFMRGLRTAAAPAPAPLTVRYFRFDAAGTRSEVAAAGDALLLGAADAIGHFYGRRARNMRVRLHALAQAARGRWFALARYAARATGDAAVGALYLAGDLAAYKFKKLPLRALQLRPYHRHEHAAEQAVNWQAARTQPLSPTAWLAPMTRRHPDVRHIFLPVGLAPERARELRNVCPAEVYSLHSRIGGADAQHENCIKCESCRVTVPGIDWNRTSGHRLGYRVPGDGRYGHDGSVRSVITHTRRDDTAQPPADTAALRALYESLRARPAQVGAERIAAWRSALADIALTAPPFLHARLSAWLERGAFGWMESELRAVLALEPVAAPAAMLAPADHAARRREHAWQELRTVFTAENLRALAGRPWHGAERAAFLGWLANARDAREHAIRSLAEWSPALAWIAAQHFIAETRTGGAIDDAIAAVVGRHGDGLSNWVTGVATRWFDSDGRAVAVNAAGAHGAGLDAAQPRRYALPAQVPGLRVDAEWVRAALNLAIGNVRTLRARALDYAQSRVQFRGDLRDVEGRESIAKFGAIKSMLAGIEQSLIALEGARGDCERAPQQVLALIRARTGVRMDAVPWMAGQIFGGMAYSEEDILAPRYRDAMVLSQWPAVAELGDNAVGLANYLTSAPLPATSAQVAAELKVYLRKRLFAPEIAPAQFAHANEFALRRTRRGVRQALWQWPSAQKLVYRSGSFIGGRLLDANEVLTPEHFFRDTSLRATRAEVLRLLRSGFRSPERGESYGHYIDRLHGIPAEDVARLRAFNAFATVVPASFGGKGWNKAQYATLNTLTMGHGDTSLGLLIMASTSIGTMPVILGLEQDLPRLERELAAGLGDPAWQSLQRDLDELLALLVRPQPAKVKEVLTRFGATAQRLLMAPGSSLKYLARHYLVLLQQTVETAKTRDLEALAQKLHACKTGLGELRELLIAERSAFDLRYGAHERFLRFLASGQISAFALTEPVAGSDTGGIQTRAVLRQVPVTADGVGFYRFTPHGGHEPRLLLDAQRLVFEGRSVRYRLHDGTVGELDDSHWDLASNTGERRIRSGARAYVFHDIGTVVKHDGGWVYRYWEVTGNKMWITNGSVADRYSLYARTDFGETGFMLERRSEGLRIGPNENKLGQRASPTNELTLERVRIGADQVIGYRGHGQVNALETLSVGRGGLVTGCATMVERILRHYRAVWAQHPAARRAAQYELDRLQTLAARLVGLMDRADLSRGDFRIEAALSKYLASEGLHRVFGWLEDIRGPQCAAQEEPIEKWRRDARILNIYEGTNEIQRFLALKDLPNLLAGLQAATVENLRLDSALKEFRDFAAPRLQALGARVWQDPDLQVRWFPVVEWMGELYAWVALYERTRVLEQRADPADRGSIRRLRQTMDDLAAQLERVAAYAQAQFDGADDPAAATLALARHALNAAASTPVAPPLAVGALTGEWLVIVRSAFEWNGEHAVWCGWQAADIGVLDRMLAWRAASPSLRVRVAAIAPDGVDDRLRRLQAGGAEVVQIAHALGPLDAAAIVAALAQHAALPPRIAIGARGGDSDDRAFAAQFAAAASAVLVTDVPTVASVRRGEWIEGAQFRRHYLARTRAAVFAWDIKPTGASDGFSADAWLRALQTPLTRIAVSPTRTMAPTLTRAPAPPASALPTAFAEPAALAAWLQQRFAAATGDEPAARLASGGAAQLPATVWVCAAAQLAAVRAEPALALLQDLASERGVASYRFDARELSVSQLIARAGCTHVLDLRFTRAPSAREWAARLAPSLVHTRYAVFGADDMPLAAALAAQLDWPLVPAVVALAGGMATVAAGDAHARCELPARAVLVAATNYRPPQFAEASIGLSVPLSVHTPEAITPRLDAFGNWQRSTEAPVGLASASVIVDVGLGVRDEQSYKNWVEPLRDALARRTGAAVEIGATRKITQELKLLPPSRQIGQTGIAVAPQLLLALGISGAPQHMSWIAKTAVVVAINRDADAPIFRFGRENGGPHIVRCVGDLQEWLPALIRHLETPPVADDDDARSVHRG